MVWGAEIPTRSRRRRRAAAWLLALLGAVLVPLAGSGGSRAASSTTIGASLEAWYLGPGTQSAPVAVEPVNGLPAANPYRADTLHVGLAGGNETARTYLRLDASGLADAPLTQATLVLPIDPSDGTVTPEAAQVVLCFAPDPGGPVDGSLSTPPPVDCSATTPARFEAAPAPHLVADLADLGLEPAVRAGGIAVLPSPAAVAAKATWHVAFFTAKTAPTPADRIHADVALKDPPAITAPTVSDGSAPALDIEPEAVPEELPSYLDTPLARLDVPEPSMSGPALLATPAPRPTPAATYTPVAVSTTTSGGFAYSIVLALPLVLLALFGVLASALSRPPVVVATVVEDHKRGRRRSRRPPTSADAPRP